NDKDYELIDLLDELVINNITELNDKIEVFNKTKNITFYVTHNLSEEQKELMREGGLLNSIKNKQ
ncbi:MAG: aconitate hydratase, partial [Erysipelotrichaceae bacterium]